MLHLYFGLRAEWFLSFLCFLPALTIVADQVASAGKIYVVAQGHPQASDEGSGNEEAPFKTISKAAEIAGPGDTILVHAGVYRERVAPKRGGTDKEPIVYQAAKGESVFVKGSDVWAAKWRTIDEAERILEGGLDAAMFPGTNPYLTTISVNGSDDSVAARPAKDGVYPETLGQIFVNGVPYDQASDPEALKRTDGSWLVNDKGDGILINFRQDEPADAEIELTVRDRIFAPYRRDLSHIVVRGFTFEHCANQGPFPQGGAVSVRSGRHWTIEGNTIRHAKTIGLDCGSEYWEGGQLNIPTAGEDKKLIIGGHHLIKGNVISDNGLCGIAGWNHKGTMVVENILERNNRLGFPRGKGWEEWAAIKFHNSDALIAGNLIRDNEAHGIWIDNGYTNAHITRNVIVNNLLSGIFLELGTSAKDRVLISNNIIANTRSGGGFYNGSGIYTHDASDIDIAHNLLLSNAGFGVTMRSITPREHGGGVAGSSRNHITNNIIAANNLGQLSLPGVAKSSHGNVSDYNLFIAGWNGSAPDFHVNQFYNAFDWTQATAVLEKRVNEHNVPENKRPDFKTWRHNPFLGFEAWRAFWEMDQHSIWLKGTEGKSFTVRSRLPELGFPKVDQLAAMKCLPHPEVTEDFNGRPLTGESVIPGPFQDAGKMDRRILLRTIIRHPSIKSTNAQQRALEQSRIIGSATEIPKPAATAPIGKTYDALSGGDPEAWFVASQPENNPGLISPFADMEKSDSPIELYRQAVDGPSSSPSRAVLFKAPKEGWYRYDIAAELSSRAGETAGFTQAELFVIDDGMKAAKSLGKFEMNVPGGHRGEELKKNFETTGEVALKKGWYLGLRFQIISPGPAPGGRGALAVRRFTASLK